MPRLLGKSSKVPGYFGIALLAAIAGSIALEYSGTINVIPGFGKEPTQTILVPQEALEKAPVTR
jgi:hypothetical protein